MTIQDQIRLLGTYPADMPVVVNGDNDAFDDVSPQR